MELWTAFILGLVGSLHCAAMCGPLALALPMLLLARCSVCSASLSRSPDCNGGSRWVQAPPFWLPWQLLRDLR